MNELGNTPADKNYKPSGISKAESRAWEAYPYKGGMKGEICAYSRPIFIQGYKQAEKDTIESVCKWLEEHFVDMSHYSDRGSFGRIETTDFDSMEEMVNDLKKALEEQK